ncbi:MAG: hypothetical protein JXR26_01455 [Balneolaceae bacterium]|nr:hypothetical protein [Balneolaceae bacterium]
MPTKDGLTLAATVFFPRRKLPNRVLVIGSALGVPRYFYFKFARFFAAHNFTVITFDYRGIYESTCDTLSGSEMKMEDWGSRDIESALGYAQNEFMPDELIYLSHSCGGQLIGLAPSCRQISKMIFVACQQGYWKLWTWPYNIGVYLTWHLLDTASSFVDYVPTKLLGISSLNLPAGVAKQWAEWGKSPHYLFDAKHGLNTSRYHKLSVPLLSYNFTDDLLLGPPKAVEALLKKYASADITQHTINPKDYNQNKIGHWRFFKEPLKDSLWHKTLKWINNQ